MATSERRPLPVRTKTVLVIVGLILFVSGIVMIFLDNNWGVLVALLGVTPVTAAFQKYKPRSGDRERLVQMRKEPLGGRISHRGRCEVRLK